MIFKYMYIEPKRVWKKHDLPNHLLLIVNPEKKTYSFLTTPLICIDEDATGIVEVKRKRDIYKLLNDLDNSEDYIDSNVSNLLSKKPEEMDNLAR